MTPQFALPHLGNVCFAIIQSFAQRQGAAHLFPHKVGHVMPREVWRGTAQLSHRYYGTCPLASFISVADSVPFGNSFSSRGLRFRGGLHG